MEVQVGPFERRLLMPVPVNPDTMHAAYDLGFLEVRLQKIPRPSGQHSVKVE
jgi:HSP20 family molecular chaperone IbpA